RVFVGFIAGVLAAFAADIANWIFYYMNITNVRFLDWASIILLGHQSNNAFQIAVMQIYQIIWDGLLGIVFSLLIPLIKSQGLVFKGVLYSFVLLFIFRAITVLFALRPLKDISFDTFISNAFCSIIWGILMPYIIVRIYDFQNNRL
ncbi:MAG: hypothetical protein AAGU27_22845, partial [Dehalobacterium sp.]